MKLSYLAGDDLKHERLFRKVSALSRLAVALGWAVWWFDVFLFPTLAPRWSTWDRVRSRIEERLGKDWPRDINPGPSVSDGVNGGRLYRPPAAVTPITFTGRTEPSRRHLSEDTWKVTELNRETGNEIAAPAIDDVLASVGIACLAQR